MQNKKLHNIKSSGFKTPNAYFESFDDMFFDKLSYKNQLDSIKGTGFKVPKDYFESLNDSILDKHLKSKETKVIPLFNRKNLIYISSTSAAILLLFYLSVFENKPTFENLKTETVNNYIINENISPYEMAALLGDEQIQESIAIEHNFSEDNLEYYLLNNADIESLMIE